MDYGPVVLLGLTLFGGVAALDGTSLGQLMLSRPLVACTLAGWIAGDPGVGALLGAVLEALHLAVLPVGAARYPESAPASVAAAGAYVALVPAHWMLSEAALLVAAVFALAWEQVGALTVHGLRTLNVRLAVAPGAEEVDPGQVERRHLAALALDFARGAALTLAGLLILRLALAGLDLEAVPRTWARVAVGTGAAAALASALRLFGRRRLWWFAAGAAAGLAVAVLR